MPDALRCIDHAHNTFSAAVFTLEKIKCMPIINFFAFARVTCVLRLLPNCPICKLEIQAYIWSPRTPMNFKRARVMSQRIEYFRCTRISIVRTAACAIPTFGQLSLFAYAARLQNDCVVCFPEVGESFAYCLINACRHLMKSLLVTSCKV